MRFDNSKIIYGPSLLVVLLISACCGGPVNGTTNTITGTAAVGAPINGGMVSAIDSTGVVVGTATTLNNGGYAITVSDSGTGPYLLKITGGTFVDPTTHSSTTGPTLHSAAVTTGTANITPFTEMIVAQSMPAGQSPEEAFNACQNAGLASGGGTAICTPIFAELTTAIITTKQSHLLTALESAIAGAGGGITDFISQPFSANSTDPMDVLLDSTKPAVIFVGGVPSLEITINGVVSSIN